MLVPNIANPMPTQYMPKSTTNCRTPIRVSGTAMFLDFTAANAQFGTHSPLQLTSPLSKSGGAPASLPLDPGKMTLTSLREAFGISQENGIGVTLFGRLPGRWLDGTLRDGAIVGPRFDFSSAGLPLPGGSPLSGDSEMIFDTPGEVSIPFSGELTFPGVAGGPVLSVPSESPLWLTVRETGWVGLRGPAEMRFADGTRLRAEVFLADPDYGLQLTLGRRGWLSLAGLPGVLPVNPGDCVPATATAPALATASQCLLWNQEAFLDFATVIRGSAAEAGSALHAGSATLPVTLGALGQTAEAWGAVLSVPVAGRTVALPALQPLLDAITLQAARAPAVELIAVETALARMKLAVTGGRLSAPNGTAPLDDVLALVRTAAKEAVPRTASTDSLNTLTNMLSKMPALLEAEAAIGGTGGADLSGLLRTALTAAFSREAASLGVVAGVYAPPAGGGVAGLNSGRTASRLGEVSAALRAVESSGIVQSPGGWMADELVI